MSSRPIPAFLAIPMLAYTIVGCSIFLSVADNYLGRARILPLPPTTAALVFLLPFAALVGIRQLMMPHPSREIIKLYTKNALVIAPFASIVFFSLLLALHPTAYWAEKSKWIYLNAYNFLVFLFAMFLPLFPVIRRKLKLISFCGLALLLWSVACDVITPGSYSVEIARAAGFPGNSNWGALAIVMLCAVSLRFNAAKSRAADIIILVSGGLGVFSTLSRSGTLNFLILVAYYVYLAVFQSSPDKRKNRKPMLGIVGTAAIVVSVLFAVVPYVLENSAMFATGNSKNRLLDFLSGKVSDDGSSAHRLGAVAHAIELIEEAPILGHGTGYSRVMPEKPHNLYLNQWVNNGLGGLLSYLALLAGGFKLFWQRKSPQGVALMLATIVGGFFSHNILEQRSFLILLGMLCTATLFESQERAAHTERM